MNITLTEQARRELRTLLARQPQGTRVRAVVCSAGCSCKPRSEIRLEFDAGFDPAADVLFDVDGIPFVATGSANACTRDFRVGLAGMPK